MGKFRPKNSKLSCLAENWHAVVDSYSNITFLSFQPLIFFWTNLSRKTLSCSFWLKIGTPGISRMLILMPTIVFWIANSKSIFGQIWAEKVKAISFCLKIDTQAQTHGISKMLIHVSILIFSNFKPKSWGRSFLFWV